MGQDQSSPIDENTPPQRLKDRSVGAIANLIKEGRARKIVVMVGAGISTSAGIPDFRSPDTGLYANLAKLDLPFAEAVFDISYFRTNPLPFYTLAHELHPGKYKPTISHLFVRLLSDKGLLLMLFSQNIDCLDRAAGVPGDKIIEAHGSFATQHCIDCKSLYPQELMDQAVSKAEVPHCLVPQCNGLVKPDIVFFGEQLPEEFHKNRTLPGAADLCIVMGTSLSVQPFASLPSLCDDGVPRLLINSDRVGGLGSRPDDVLLLGDCDTGVRQLAAALGWEAELETLWRDVSCSEGGEGDRMHAAHKSKDESLDDQIATLTKEVDQALQISNEHDTKVRSQLAKREPSDSAHQTKLEARTDLEPEQFSLGKEHNLEPDNGQPTSKMERLSTLETSKSPDSAKETSGDESKKSITQE